jgi:hypothetical protein
MERNDCTQRKGQLVFENWTAYGKIVVRWAHEHRIELTSLHNPTCRPLRIRRDLASGTHNGCISTAERTVSFSRVAMLRVMTQKGQSRSHEMRVTGGF